MADDLDGTGNMSQYAVVGLLTIGVILVVGGIVLAITGSEGPEWVGKTIAIVVGALITLAGAAQIRHHE